MRTSTFTPSAPAMPAVWPRKHTIKPVRRRFPNTVDEPRNIGYYLAPLRYISQQPDRSEIMKAYLMETYV
ncbi:hypothetical protein [Bacteroides reticulotermitis]|uniref:Uncharacterized protein n=1 Tax=Bacteroides reticulotermitis TaxID=1133319 RepID=A0A840D4S6_9BACE|nr:hypothetical protein [Bacteroides reticulotermitis]MBB4045809.1 hypothetical protein [Bacteroides reticulotermitis]